MVFVDAIATLKRTTNTPMRKRRKIIEAMAEPSAAAVPVPAKGLISLNLGKKRSSRRPDPIQRAQRIKVLRVFIFSLSSKATDQDSIFPKLGQRP